MIKLETIEEIRNSKAVATEFKEHIFPLTLEELDSLVYKQAYSSARNILDRSKDNTKNGQRDRYKNVKCKLGKKAGEVCKTILGNERLLKEFRKAKMIHIINNERKTYLPEVHRVNENGDYEIDNITILNKLEHVIETVAKSTIVKVVDINKESSKPIPLKVLIEAEIQDGQKFKSIAETKKFLSEVYGVSSYEVDKFVDSCEKIIKDNHKIEIFIAKDDKDVIKKQLKNIENKLSKTKINFQMPENIGELLNKFHEAYQNQNFKMNNLSM